MLCYITVCYIMFYYVMLCYGMVRYGMVRNVRMCIYCLLVHTHTYIYDYIHTMSLAVAESMGDVSLSLPFSSTTKKACHPWKGDH